MTNYQRQARKLKQRVLQVHYCNDDFGVLYVTNKVWHSLLKTPARQRFMAFNWGTLGESNGTNDARIFQSAKAARRVVAQRLLRLSKLGEDGMGGLVGMRMQGWKREFPEPEIATKAHKYFESRILPWARRQVGK